ncbi:MAG: glycosyltransferase [Bacteroidales bacterium]|nr:glycosyltransferase [Bacteroidales bacterium]
MKYLAYFILFFTIIQFITALINVVFRQKFKTPKNFELPLISILIPARNEEKNISNILNNILAQNYKNFEVIVFNDMSEDNTKNIVENFTKTDSRIKLINSQKLPEGWLGKNNACFEMSKVAKGDYFLFLDADITIGDDVIFNTLNHIKFYKLNLLSIFPKQIMKTNGEWLTVPLMNYILLTLLPLIFVRKSWFSSHSAANGQFMLFDAKTYKEINPHKIMKNQKVEDIKIARYYKKNKFKVACLSAKEGLACRMYNNFNDAVLGFSKNIKMFFGNSFFLSATFWLFNTFGIVLSIVFLDCIFVILHIILLFLIKIMTSIASKQNILKNLLLFIPQQFIMGYIIFKSIKKQKQWKGRNI